jgi:Ni2+-binding GTPase involved in maturation of urease and hydrogenase
MEVSAEEAATYSAKFGRCQRLDAKRKQINKEVDANVDAFRTSWGIVTKTDLNPTREAEIKVMRECVQKIKRVLKVE